MSEEPVDRGVDPDLATLARSSRMSAVLTIGGALLVGWAVFAFASSRGAPNEQVREMENKVTMHVDMAVKKIPQGPPGPPGPAIETQQWKQLQAKLDALPETVASKTRIDSTELATALAARLAKDQPSTGLPDEEVRRLRSLGEDLSGTLASLKREFGERLGPSPKQLDQAQQMIAQMLDVLRRHR